MTAFNFNTWNHCRQGQIIVEDITRIIGYQLIALGHNVSWDNQSFFRNRINFVIESFADDPKTLELITLAHSQGSRFIYIATEEPTPAGFNHGLEPAMIDRQNAFPKAAEFCEGILTLIPGEHVRAWYGQFAPTAHVELGYAPGFIDHIEQEPEWPFGFYGKMTWRREQMIATLERMTAQPVLQIKSLDVPLPERNRLMKRAKVILQIRANEEWGMVSNSRCASALSFGRPVVAEPHPYSKPWDDIVHFSTSVESFYDDAIDAVADWRSLHRAQLGRFKLRLFPEVCVGQPLREIGIL